MCTATIDRNVCHGLLQGGYAEKCRATMSTNDTSANGALYKLVCVVSDPFFSRTCKDTERLHRELDKAAASSRIDLRNAAARVRKALIVGDKTTVYLSLRDIDPPCAYLFDYSQP